MLLTEKEALEALEEFKKEITTKNERVKQSKQWEKIYPELLNKVEEFRAKLKIDAARSYKTKMIYLGYAIRFFIEIEQTKNIRWRFPHLFGIHNLNHVALC